MYKLLDVKVIIVRQDAQNEIKPETNANTAMLGKAKLGVMKLGVKLNGV